MSLPLTSARLPAETNVDRPSLRCATDSRIAMPSAPDWEKKPILPRPGEIGAKVAFSEIAGSVLMTPRQLGPITRMPLANAVTTNWRSAARPADPVSPKPEEMITSPRTDLRAHSSTTAATLAAGVAITATDRGNNSRWIDWDSARCSRERITLTERSVNVMRSREHRAESQSIQRLLFPQWVAVVGASRQLHRVGTTVFRNLLNSGFQGPVYPVNPHGGHVASVRAYPSVLDIDDEVDLAVIATPAASVAAVVEECARKSVRGLVIISSGFGETGSAGRAAERQLVVTALASGMRVIGPNCLGVINTDPAISLNATLAPISPGRGKIGFFSQSGALGIAILESVAQRR